MRLWSIHPKYLDSRGLVALWREALLAKKVLEGKTKGYRNHPQLERFRGKSLAIFNFYLLEIWKDADRRGFSFDRSKMGMSVVSSIPINDGQLVFELDHLKKKLKTRDPAALKKLIDIKKPVPHPLFSSRPGDVEFWERI